MYTRVSSSLEFEKDKVYLKQTNKMNTEAIQNKTLTKKHGILLVYLDVMWPKTNISEPWACKSVVKLLKYLLKISLGFKVNILSQRVQLTKKFGNTYYMIKKMKW